MKINIRSLCGITLIALGLLAMPIPVIPGLPLVAAGVGMLGPDHPLVRTGRTWLERVGFWKAERKRNELSNVYS